MFRYTAECFLRQQPDVVMSYVSDPTRQTDWVHGVSECHWVVGGGPAQGAVAEQTMTFMGKERIVPMTMTEYGPSRVAFEKQQPFPIRFGFEVEPHAGGTRLRYPVEMQPGGLMRLVISLMGRKIIHGDLERIADQLARLEVQTAVQPREA